MTFILIRNIFAWCLVMNIALLFFWFIMFTFAQDWIYRMHSKFYKITTDDFNRIHYNGIMLFKIFIFVFNLVPYLAMHIAG